MFLILCRTLLLIRVPLWLRYWCHLSEFFSYLNCYNWLSVRDVWLCQTLSVASDRLELTGNPSCQAHVNPSSCLFYLLGTLHNTLSKWMETDLSCSEPFCKNFPFRDYLGSILSILAVPSDKHSRLTVLVDVVLSSFGLAYSQSVLRYRQEPMSQSYKSQLVASSPVLE